MVVDVIDLWPELFEIIFPRIVRPFAKLLLGPLYQKRKKFLRQADGFLAVAQNYLKLAQSIAPKTPGAVAYLGADTKLFLRNDAQRPVDPRIATLRKRPGEVWCVYVGTLGRNYDIDAVLQCARRLTGSNVRILVAGDGDCRTAVEHASKKGFVSYLGRLSFESLITLYTNCDIALACYASGSTVSMPFKAFDYLAAGLPIVTSLRGDLEAFVCDHQLGQTYTAGDPDTLYSAIQALAQNTDFRRNAARRAKQLGNMMDYDIQYGFAADFLEKVAAQNRASVSIRI